MIPKSSGYGLVVGGVCVAKGSLGAMRAMKKKSPGSVIWVSYAMAVGFKVPSAVSDAIGASLAAADAARRSAA